MLYLPSALRGLAKDLEFHNFDSWTTCPGST